MTKTIETITAKIYLSLREEGGDRVHNIKEVKYFLERYFDKRGANVTITPTAIIYKEGRETRTVIVTITPTTFIGGREEGAMISLINYPRFSSNKREIKRTAKEIASICEEQYKQKRISIEYSAKTRILE